ncbi:HNH endonuclease [Pectinatus frisingensis]|uniref:HNH endonuclease signature motif containing protein n=1 Tax=Pectinatus frisingensis TaxID=865 RepID=UPI0018C50C6C|nr:HNH endonuclease [Pectinatus frisingensis]
MARAFAKSFYNSAAWKHTSKAYAASKFYLCEICGRPYKIVHHKKWLTPENINNPDITLNWNNLMCVCLDCHNRIKEDNEKSKLRNIIFDSDGNVIDVKD